MRHSVNRVAKERDPTHAWKMNNERRDRSKLLDDETTLADPDPPHDFLTECSRYVDPQGTVHLIGRDDRRSKYLYHAISADDGETWSAPVPSGSSTRPTRRTSA